MLLTRANVAEPWTVVDDIVSKVSRDHFDGNLRVEFGTAPSRTSVRFVLRCRSSRGPGARLSHSGRRTVAATWEAHRLVMLALFDAMPGATLRTAMATYRGRAGFLRDHGATYYRNVGSVMQPATYGEL